LDANFVFIYKLIEIYPADSQLPRGAADDAAVAVQCFLDEILFDRLEQNGYITLEQKTLLRRIWATRNKSVHPVASLSQEEVENMIDTIEQICLAWDAQA